MGWIGHAHVGQKVGAQTAMWNLFCLVNQRRIIGIGGTTLAKPIDACAGSVHAAQNIIVAPYMYPLRITLNTNLGIEQWFRHRQEDGLCRTHRIEYIPWLGDTQRQCPADMIMPAYGYLYGLGQTRGRRNLRQNKAKPRAAGLQRRQSLGRNAHHIQDFI